MPCWGTPIRAAPRGCGPPARRGGLGRRTRSARRGWRRRTPLGARRRPGAPCCGRGAPTTATDRLCPTTRLWRAVGHSGPGWWKGPVGTACQSAWSSPGCAGPQPAPRPSSPSERCGSLGTGRPLGRFIDHSTISVCMARPPPSRRGQKPRDCHWWRHAAIVHRLWSHSFDFSQGKRGAVVPHQGKTRITLWVDTEVLDWFRALAEREGRGYQTAMNAALRQYTQQAERPLHELVRDVIREELQKLPDLVKEMWQATPGDMNTPTVPEVSRRDHVPSK